MAEGPFGSGVILNNGKYDFLIDHALRNVWCNPEQDNQHILAPQRISHPTGVLNYCDVMKRRLPLPSKGERYHLFQIGQLPPLVLGLLQRYPSWTQEHWVNIADAVTQRKMLVDIYVDSGVQIPRFEVYYMYTSDRDLILAIKENNKVGINYREFQPYFRVYSNAYFKSIRANADVEGTYCYGKRILLTPELLETQHHCLSYTSKPGLVTCYVNGYLVDKLDLYTMKLGDTVEFVYDSSVIRTVDFTVGDLPVFDSALDSKRKYLLHYNHQNNQTIDYLDDNDFYVLDRQTNGRFNGVYYHRNSNDACRMVTHRDYSLVVQYFTNFASQLQIKANERVIDNQALVVRMIVRKSGYLRPLVFEHQRIQELYKLPDDKVLSAMVGTNAVVPEWTASALEASQYCAIMRSPGTTISREMVRDAYGYNAVSKLLGDTPKLTRLSSGRKQIDVPYGLSYKSTAYEYDVNGKLLGHYHHESGSIYNAANSNAHLVEMISGVGDYQPDVRFGTNQVPVPSGNGYRVYRCHLFNGLPDNVWDDITGSDEYEIVDGKINWLGSDYNSYLMVRTDAKFLAYDLNILPTGGVLHFTFSEMETRANGLQNFVLPVPMGELDLFLNGHALIENLDYIVNFPEVIVFNKRFLKYPQNSTTQKIHVRFTGFCKSDLTRDTSADIGWVQYGMLSKNNRHDIRDDRVLRIVMNGGVFDRSQLLFSEEHAGLGLVNSQNGFPYQIRDIVVPVRGNVDADTYAYRSVSQSVDQRVSDYLTTLLPEAPQTAKSSIESRYDVTSPFIARLIYDMQTGTISDNEIPETLSDSEILAFCAPYERWLAFDPINPEHRLDENYVSIHPWNTYSAVELNIIQYSFLRRIVKLYADGLVDVSGFILVV